MTHNDTIAAPATAHGRGAVALVRISGPRAIEIADSIWKGKRLSAVDSHTAHLGYIVTQDTESEEVIDQALATVFKAPTTFTGEDMVEFGLHGSMLIVRRTLKALTDAGARPAGPGEFSQRAVTNGRMSLVSAEAAADLVAATSDAARRIAMSQMRGGVDNRLKQMQQELLNLVSLLELELDFSEEEVEFASRTELLNLAVSVQTHLRKLQSSYRTGAAIKQGIPVAIIGPTNAGKSSLLNMLADDERAIVSDIHGTTRDIVEDSVEIGQYLFRFMDTAGLRETDDSIEQIGIAHSYRALGKARIVLLVTDISTPLPADILQKAHELIAHDATLIHVRNKADKLDDKQQNLSPDNTVGQQPSDGIKSIAISAKTSQGIDKLKEMMCEIISCEEQAEGEILLTNERHYVCVTQALESLDGVIEQLKAGDDESMYATPDLIAQSVREVISSLSELTGQSLQTPAILQNIFSRFCIGK